MTIVTTRLCVLRERYKSSSFYTTCIFTVTSLPQSGAISLLTSGYIDSFRYSQYVPVRGKKERKRGGCRDVEVDS